MTTILASGALRRLALELTVREQRRLDEQEARLIEELRGLGFLGGYEDELKTGASALSGSPPRLR